MIEKTKTVLILDDEFDVRNSLVNFFEDRDWIVFPAETAEDAIDILTKESPDCAVVDNRLPGMDGNAFIRTVSETHPTLVCVVCTGSLEYHLPMDVAALPQMSEIVFSKPLRDLARLEDELCQQIKKRKAKDKNNG